jgi:hypothetical protein
MNQSAPHLHYVATSNAGSTVVEFDTLVVKKDVRQMQWVVLIDVSNTGE